MLLHSCSQLCKHYPHTTTVALSHTTCSLLPDFPRIVVKGIALEAGGGLGAAAFVLFSRASYTCQCLTLCL